MEDFYDSVTETISYEEYELLTFFQCMIALNVETIDDEFEKKEVRRSGKSFSRDYEMLTMEICLLGNTVMLFHMFLLLNPVLFMSLFGHALFNYNPPKRSREVW